MIKLIEWTLWLIFMIGAAYFMFNPDDFKPFVKWLKSYYNEAVKFYRLKRLAELKTKVQYYISTDQTVPLDIVKEVERIERRWL